MYDILAAEDLCETTDYIESLSNAPDNTNGAELDRFSMELIREINEIKG